MRLTLLEEPDTEPLSADEVRAQLGIGTEITDATLEAFITAARQQLDGPDGLLGRALITQRWQGDLDDFPCNNGNIEIPLPPLQEIVSLTYINSDGDTVTMVEDDDYRLRLGARPYITTISDGVWPSSGGVTVTFLAGYGDDGDTVPGPIKQAMVMLISNYRSMSARNLFVSREVVDGIGETQYVVSDNAGQAVDATVKSLVSRYTVMVV